MPTPRDFLSPRAPVRWTLSYSIRERLGSFLGHPSFPHFLTVSKIQRKSTGNRAQNVLSGYEFLIFLGSLKSSCRLWVTSGLVGLPAAGTTQLLAEASYWQEHLPLFLKHTLPHTLLCWWAASFLAPAFWSPGHWRVGDDQEEKKPRKTFILRSLDPWIHRIY